jgi:hypothetical protein
MVIAVGDPLALEAKEVIRMPNGWSAVIFSRNCAGWRVSQKNRH